jgi:hypothetical protein
MIIGITGLCIDSVGNKRVAGAGKDVVARRLLEKYNFTQVAWADPLKRFCKEVYDFAGDQLWGESDARVLPDKRYPRGDGTFLTPREALQSLGTGWGRGCYKDTWVDYGIRVAKKILAGGSTYTPMYGLQPKPTWMVSEGLGMSGVVFSDLRFLNELNAVRKAGGKIVRIKRTVDHQFDMVGMNHSHDSEVELPNEPDSICDYVIDNSGMLEELIVKIDEMLDVFRGSPRT